jgi:Transposase
MCGFAACNPPRWLAMTTTSLDDAMRRNQIFAVAQFASFSTSGNGRELFCEGRYDWPGCGRGDRSRDYFAGLDISMDETHICVLDREGVVVRESKTESMVQAIAGELAKAPTCRRTVFETGRMAPILFHGLNQLGLPVVCVESRQAYQALKSLATHKTDRNDARGWRIWPALVSSSPCM